MLVMNTLDAETVLKMYQSLKEPRLENHVLAIKCARHLRHPDAPYVDKARKAFEQVCPDESFEVFMQGIYDS